MLKLNGISAGYGKLQILDNVSIEVPPGKVTVIVGPNGSGKSTLLKSVAGIARIFSGTVELDGKIISAMSAPEIARLGLTYLPQTDNCFTSLTVRGNLRISGYMCASRITNQGWSWVLEMFPILSDYWNTKVANLSGGERQMLSMSMALIRKPSTIMFDEPTANLSPKLSTQVLKTIASLTKDLNLATVLVKQNVRRALEMGDNVYLLVGGQTAFYGSCTELLEHKELGKLYLGLQSA